LFKFNREFLSYSLYFSVFFIFFKRIEQRFAGDEAKIFFVLNLSHFSEETKNYFSSSSSLENICLVAECISLNAFFQVSF
jgi:hypothetical protein